MTKDDIELSRVDAECIVQMPDGHGLYAETVRPMARVLLHLHSLLSAPEAALLTVRTCETCGLTTRTLTATAPEPKACPRCATPAHFHPTDATGALARLRIVVPHITAALDLTAAAHPEATVALACLARESDGSGCIEAEFDGRVLIEDVGALLGMLTVSLPDDLAAIEARAEAATPGPWDVELSEVVYVAPDVNPIPTWAIPAIQDLAGEMSDADAHFIAHARADVPRLLSRVRAQAAEIAALREERDVRRRASAELIEAIWDIVDPDGDGGSRPPLRRAAVAFFGEDFRGPVVEKDV